MVKLQFLNLMKYLAPFSAVKCNFFMINNVLKLISYTLVEASSADGTGGSYWPLQPNWPQRHGFTVLSLWGSRYLHTVYTTVFDTCVYYTSVSGKLENWEA